MAFGISQLQSLDDRAECTLTFADCEVYFDKTITLKKFDASTLQNISVIGRGGTNLSIFLNEYKEKLGEKDFLIIISDMYLCDTDWANMINPGVFVLTSLKKITKVVNIILLKTLLTIQK